ncbi:hypothetical protein IAU60_001032 [Kwoniella sp. DSM 27419]
MTWGSGRAQGGQGVSARADQEDGQGLQAVKPESVWSRCRYLVWRHLHFVGPGLVSSVAYIDPGNWATDLEAGAHYGYKLLFVVFIAGLAAVVLQLLSVRLGATTSLSLPAQTRLIFIRLQAKYPKYRVPLTIGLWTLYGLAEIAIIATDLAELLGSAIALNLLFPKLPLYAGVLITAVDVLVVLVFFRSNKGRQGMLFFEILIVSLVLAVFVSFMILLKLINPVWKDVFFGLVPSKTLVDPGALYVGVGIIGATVMPHALFLGSSLASVDRLNMLPVEPTLAKGPRRVSMPAMNLNPFRRRRPRPRQESDTHIATQSQLSLPTERARPNLCDDEITRALSRSGSRRSEVPLDTPCKDLASPMTVDDENLSDEQVTYNKAIKQYEMEIRRFDRIKWVDIHLLHATIDTTLSLLGFALTINSSILTLAGAAFYYGTSGASADDADLFGAFALIKSYIGNAAAIIFALALLCAGQSASITATLAGQIVSEGFINWKTSPFIRRAVTRLISVIPAATVAAAVGPKGLNTMLVASQVLLSIVLPTVIFPLVWLCSKEEIMTVQGPEVDDLERENGAISMSAIGHGHGTSSPCQAESASRPASPSEGVNPATPSAEQVEDGHAPRRRKSYVSPKYVTVLGYALFGVVVVANVYVIVQLGLGND